MTYPKVLIIGQPFDRRTGGGITLTNLFAGWEKDRLAVVCSGKLLSGNSICKDMCRRYYRLGSGEEKWSFPFNFFQHKSYSGPVCLEAEDHSDQPIAASRTRRRWIIERLFFPVLAYTGWYNAVFKIHLSKELLSWLLAYDPDVLYAQANSLAEVSFCLSIQSALQKPMVFHMMDDWPQSEAHSGIFHFLWKRKTANLLARLFDVSAALLSIGEYMSEEYLKRYGKEFIPFHNAVPSGFRQSGYRLSYALHTPPALLYAGRTGLGIDASLKTIAKAVAQLNEETQWGVRFVLQTENKPDWADTWPWVAYRPPVPYAALPGVFARADALILPYDFSPGSLGFIRFSIPAKLSEYLASGTPVLVFAPADTALVRFAREHQCAEIVVENSVNELAAALKALLGNEDRRRELALRAQKLAHSEFNPNNVASAFKNILCAAAKPKRSASLGERRGSGEKAASWQGLP